MPYTKKTTTAPKKDAINKETDTKVTNESKTTNTPVVEERIFIVGQTAEMSKMLNIEI